MAFVRNFFEWVEGCNRGGSEDEVGDSPRKGRNSSRNVSAPEEEMSGRGDSTERKTWGSSVKPSHQQLDGWKNGQSKDQLPKAETRQPDLRYSL